MRGRATIGGGIAAPASCRGCASAARCCSAMQYAAHATVAAAPLASVISTSIALRTTALQDSTKNNRDNNGKPRSLDQSWQASRKFNEIAPREQPFIINSSLCQYTIVILSMELSLLSTKTHPSSCSSCREVSLYLLQSTIPTNIRPKIGAK